MGNCPLPEKMVAEIRWMLHRNQEEVYAKRRDVPRRSRHVHEIISSDRYVSATKII